MVIHNNKLSPAQVIYAFLYLLLTTSVVLWMSGDWYWLEGWIFTLWFLIECVVTLVYLYRKDPALLKERFKKPGTGNQAGWDTYIIYAIVLLFWTWLIIMPLDARRYQWTSDFPAEFKVLGGVFLIISFFFFYRAFTDNPYLSPLVRVQEERKHQVITTGVYSIVRHPMYLGSSLMFLGAPLLMGSLYGLVMGFLLSMVLVIRIGGEEKLLATQLEGYEEYRKKVKYRLIPYVW